MSLGLLETSLYVADLDRSEAFYRDLLGAPIVLSEERMRALRLPDGRILLLFAVRMSEDGETTPGGHIPGHGAIGRQHLAFSAAPDELDRWRDRLKTLGVTLESEVHPDHGGRSLYFRDPDDHSVEFADRAIWDDLPPLAAN